MKSKRLMTIGIVLALLIAVVGVVLSVSLTACGKDVITVRSEKELLKAAGTSQEKTIVLMDDVVVNGDLKVAAPNKIDLNGFGLEVKGTLSADGSGTLVVGTTALILARRETVKAQKIDINMPQGHVEWNAHIDLPASAATSADAMTVVTSASSFVFKGVFKIGGAEADIMLTLKGGRFEISNMSESSAATVLVPEQAVGAAVENLSQGAMRVEAHSDVAVGGEVEISSKNSEVNVTALESQAETKITVTDGTVKKIDAAGAQVVVAESAQAGDVVAEKLENNGTVTGAVVADEIVNNGTLAEENVNAALKTAAKKALNDGFATYSQDDYTSENWAKLTKAKDDGLAAIDSALTEAAIQSAKNTALDAMAAVETIAEATARELAEAKTAATEALKTAFNGYTETDYDAQTWATLKAAYDNGLAAIEAATDVSAVNTAKQTALDAMAACVPKDVEALTQAKAEAKAAIEAAFKAYDEDDYASANWTELTIAYNRGLNEVEAATSVSAVDTAKQTAITAMAAVKDNATLLADAKTAALASLDAAKAEYSQDDYATNWSVLEQAYNDGKTEINAAAAIEAVNSALQKATDAMAAVKSDATLLAEAKTAATDRLNSEYAKYKATDYTNANYELLTDKYNAGLTAIGGARTVDAVETALETAIAEMAAIKTNAQILADAKAAAKSELETEKAKYSQSDYTINWSVLEQAYNDGLTAIDASKTTSAVDTAKQAAIAAMAAVKTDAEELEAAKSAAKDELKEYFDAFNKAYYYETSLQALQTAYDSGVSAISAAQSVADVATALANAKTALDNVKADVTEVNDADSLKAAVEAQYSKIILTANISGAYIEVNYDLTLDLNGFGLVLEDRTHAAVKVNGGASFTLCDGSAAKSGKIKSDYAGIIAIGSDADKAVVEINGGTIEVDNSAYWSNGASNVGYAVYADNAEVEMWGGEIIAKGQYVTEDDSVFGINLRNGSSATVHAGKIKSDTYGVVVYYNSAFTLDGGEITATWFAISGNNLAPAADITVKSGSATSTEDVAIYMPSQGSLTVSGGHIKGLAAIEMRAGKLVVNSGTMIGNGDPFESDPNGNGATTLGAAVAAVQHTTKLDLSVEINGGTLQGARAFYQANLQNNGKEALEKISITLGKSAVYNGEIIVDSAEATIEDDQSTRYYMTLQQAVDAAEDDETVVVAKDLSASGAEYLVTLDDESKTVTVDLNGKTLLYTGSGTGSNPQNGEAISVNAGKLVLKNGTVNMVNDETGGSVYWGIRVHGTGSLAMSKVTVTSEDSPLFMSGVSAGGRIYLTLDECYIEGVYSAVYMNGSTSPAEITINNSTIVSTGDVGIYVSNSVATGNRQKLTITDSTVTGTTAIEVKHTDATITGCTLIGTAAEQLSVKNGNGSCTEGFAFAVTGNGDTDKTTGTVVVSGCKFYNGKPSSTDAEENGFYFVFTTAEGASVTVDGAAADETADYGAYEARVSNAWFDTFENAVKNAEANGKTVVLLKDVEVGEAGSAATGLVVSGTLTVDFNGFTVSNVGTGYAVVVSGSDAKVTLIDSSKEQTGGIYGGSGGDNQALRVENGATLDIYGGNYNVGGDAQGEGNSTVAIRTNSTVNIYGGRFASEKDYQGKYFVLNVQQTTGASGYIKVYGGTFVGQNPADGDDALGGSFVADGYEAVVSKAATDESLAEYTVQKAQ